MTEKLFYPLNEKDVKSLENGKTVIKNFHGFTYWLMVVAWNKDKQKRLKKSAFNEARKAGISIANIPLGHEELAKIKNKEGYSVFFSGFEVLVVLESTFQALKKEATT